MLGHGVGNSVSQVFSLFLSMKPRTCLYGLLTVEATENNNDDFDKQFYPYITNFFYQANRFPLTVYRFTDRPIIRTNGRNFRFCE